MRGQSVGGSNSNADALGFAALLVEELTNWDGTKKRGLGIQLYIVNLPTYMEKRHKWGD